MRNGGEINSNNPQEEKTLKHIIWEISHLSFRATISSLAVNSGFFVNAWILAKLDTTALAASSLATSSQLLTIAVAKGALSSIGVVSNRNSDKGNAVQGIILQSSGIQGVIASVSIVGLFLLSDDIFIYICRQNTDVARLAGEYLRWYSLAVPSNLFLKSIEQFFIARKYMWTPIVANIFNTGASGVLSYYMVHGGMGLTASGISGAAKASVIINWLTLFALLFYAYGRQEFKKYKIFAYESEYKRYDFLKTLTFVGVPIAIQMFVEFFYNFMKSVVAGSFGAVSLSAEQIVIQYASIVMCPIFAISTITGNLIAEDIATGHSKNIKKIGNTGIVMSMFFPCFALVFFVVMPSQLMQLFVGNSASSYEDIYEIARWLFLINGINNVIDAIKNTIPGALRGFYDAKIPALIALVSLCMVGFPSSYLLAYAAKLAVAGFFIGRGLSLAGSLPSLCYRWHNSAEHPDRALVAAKARETETCTMAQSACELWGALFPCCAKNTAVDPAQQALLRITST